MNPEPEDVLTAAEVEALIALCDPALVGQPQDAETIAAAAAVERAQLDHLADVMEMVEQHRQPFILRIRKQS